MRPPKYPLESLIEVREGKVERASEDLARAARDGQEAEQRRRDCERRRDAHALETASVRGAQTRALARGELTAADLSCEEAWRARAMTEQQALVAEVDRAISDASRAREIEELARGDLASRQAEAKIVTEDRSRWRQAQQKRQEAKDEEASSDAWRSRKT